MFTLEPPQHMIFGYRPRGAPPEQATILYEGPIVGPSVHYVEGVQVGLLPWELGIAGEHRIISFSLVIENNQNPPIEGSFDPQDYTFSVFFQSQVVGAIHIMSALATFLGLESTLDGSPLTLTQVGCWGSIDIDINQRPIGRGQGTFVTFEVACTRLTLLTNQRLLAPFFPPAGYLTDLALETRAPNYFSSHLPQRQAEMKLGNHPLSEWLRGLRVDFPGIGFGSSGEEGRFSSLLMDARLYGSEQNISIDAFLQSAYIPLIEEIRRPWHITMPTVEHNQSNSCYLFGVGIHPTSRFQENIVNRGIVDGIDGPNSEHMELASFKVAETFGPGHLMAHTLVHRGAIAASNILCTHDIAQGGYGAGGWGSLRAVGRCLQTMARGRLDLFQRAYVAWINGSNGNPPKVPADFGIPRDPTREVHEIMDPDTGVLAPRIVEFWQFFSLHWIFEESLSSGLTHDLCWRVINMLLEGYNSSQGFPRFTIAGKPQHGRDYEFSVWIVPLLRKAVDYLNGIPNPDPTTIAARTEFTLMLDTHVEIALQKASNDSWEAGTVAKYLIGDRAVGATWKSLFL